VIRRAVLLVEIAILSALVPAARCANYQDVFAPEMFTSSFRFCVIGTSGFGQMRWNTRAEWSSATNGCNCAIWRSVWNHQRCVRFSRRGGFHLRLRIGLATRYRWQFPREPEGNCRETAIFRDGRLARSACNSGKSRGSCVRTYDSARLCRISRPSSVWQCSGMLAAPF